VFIVIMTWSRPREGHPKGIPWILLRRVANIPRI